MRKALIWTTKMALHHLPTCSTHIAGGFHSIRHGCRFITSSLLPQQHPRNSSLEQEVYSAFPSTYLNSLGNLSEQRAWQLPTTPMPRCRIVLNVEEWALPPRPCMPAPGFRSNKPTRPQFSRFLEQQSLDRWWKKSLRAGVIELCKESDLLHIAPMIPVLKKKANVFPPTQNFRWIINYRTLNYYSQRSINGTLPVTRYNIPKFLSWVSSLPAVVSIDLTDAFSSCPVEPKSKRLLGIERFRNRSSAWNQFACFNVMPQGICDGPDIFASFLKWIFDHLPTSDRLWVYNYLDDIFVGGVNAADAQQRADRLEVLIHHFGIRINPTKTISPQTAATFPGLTVLGHRIQTNGKITIPQERKESFEKRLQIFGMKLQDCLATKAALYSADLNRDVAGITGFGNQFSYLIPQYLYVFRTFLNNNCIVTCPTKGETTIALLLQLSSIQGMLDKLRQDRWHVDVFNPMDDIIIKIHPTCWPAAAGWEATLYQILNASQSELEGRRSREKGFNYVEASTVVWRCHTKFRGPHSRWVCLTTKRKELEGVIRTLTKLVPVLTGWSEASRQIVNHNNIQTLPGVKIEIHDRTVFNLLEGYFNSQTKNSDGCVVDPWNNPEFSDLLKKLDAELIQAAIDKQISFLNR